MAMLNNQKGIVSGIIGIVIHAYLRELAMVWLVVSSSYSCGIRVSGAPATLQSQQEGLRRAEERRSRCAKR